MTEPVLVYMATGRYTFSVFINDYDVGEIFKGKSGWWFVHSSGISLYRDAPALNAGLNRVMNRYHAATKPLLPARPEA